MKTTIIKTNSVMKNFVKYICAVLLVVGTSASAWGVDPPTVADLNFGTATYSEDFNSVSTTSTTAQISSISTSQSNYGAINHLYNNNTANANEIAVCSSGNNMTSNYFKLYKNSGHHVIAQISGGSFAQAGAWRATIEKTSHGYIGLYNISTDQTAVSYSTVSAVIQNDNGTITIQDGTSKSNWTSVGSSSNNTIDICVIYNLTNESVTYGGSISLASMKAHVYIDGTCVNTSGTPKAFTLRNNSTVSSFRISLPTGNNEKHMYVDDIKVYNALPTQAGNTITLSKNNSDLSGSANGAGRIVADAKTMTITTAPTRTGYEVEGYYTTSACETKIATSAGALQASITVGGNTWTNSDSEWKRGADETFYTNWTAKTYTVTFDKQSGSGGSDDVTATYDDAMPAATMPTREGYNFEGYFTETGGSGTKYYNANGSSATDWKEATNTTLYAHWSAKSYSDYRFSCANLSLTGPTADLVFITSAASKTVRSQEAFHIEGDGLTPGATVTFSFGSDALNELFSFKKADGTAPTVSNPGGTIDVDVYVYYTPTGTTDGLDQATNLTATVAGAKPKKATLNTKTIIGRHLPANFVIATKFADNKWYALPANKATGNLTPVPIRVNSESAPTTAYCEKTNSFTLYQDNTSNSPKVILGLTNYKNDKDVSYALFGSSSGSTIGKSDGTVTGSIGDQYKWTLAQQATSVSGIGDVKYLINVTNNARPLAIRTYSGSTTWGLHPASGVRDTLMRLLTLQEVQPMSLKVMEWGTDAIVVSYPNGGSASGVQAAIGDASPSSVTMTSLGGDIYKISTISGLQSNPSKPLYIMATESGTSKQAVVTIPLIVTASKTEAQLRESLPGATADIRNATAKYIDVIIRNGGTMTTGTGSGNFADLYIYPGGKAIVSNNMSFGTIYMRGGYSFLDNKATYRYPDLCVKSGTITTSGVKYDLYIDNRYYYTFAMPYDVALTDVHDETGSDDFNVWVKHYNGETRASGTHVSGWEWYGDNKETQHSFFAGIGYEITAKPKVSGRPIAIIRFPVKTGNITSDASREIGVSVSNYGYDAYGSGSLAANNVGWNFVGNPYLTEYKAGTASPGNANDTLMIVAQGYVQHIDPTTGVWDGTYDWQASNKRFITVPYDTQSDYHSEYVATYAIPAFSAFFIQTKDEGTFYMRGTRPQAAGVAPRYMQAQREMPEVHLDVLLRGDNEAVEAKAGLIIHDKYEGGLKDFEDVEQWFVDQNEQKTYTFASGTALAYNLLNEHAATQVIPMGYIATVAGEHVYSISESNDVSRLAQLLLTDYETGLTTDLLVHDYVFTTEAGRFDERFAISAVLEKDEVVTEVAGTSSDSWTKTIGVYRDGNTLTLRGLPEGSSAYVYDMTGKLIASGQHLHNVASFSIAAQGVYNIRVVDGERAVTLRSVLH